MGHIILPLMMLMLSVGLSGPASAQQLSQFAVVTVEFEKPEFSFTSKFHEANRELAKMDVVRSYFYSNKLKAFVVEAHHPVELNTFFSKLGQIEAIDNEKFNQLIISQLAYKIATNPDRYSTLVAKLPALPASVSEKVSVIEVYLNSRPEIVNSLSN